MNKYYQMLDKILRAGKVQTNKKGRIRYLLNERLVLTPADLLDTMRTTSTKQRNFFSEVKILKLN